MPCFVASEALCIAILNPLSATIPPATANPAGPPANIAVIRPIDAALEIVLFAPDISAPPILSGTALTAIGTSMAAPIIPIGPLAIPANFDAPNLCIIVGLNADVSAVIAASPAMPGNIPLMRCCIGVNDSASLTTEDGVPIPGIPRNVAFLMP